MGTYQKKFRAFYFMSETEKYGNNAHKKAAPAYFVKAGWCGAVTVKMSETPYPTNGSGKNLGKECEY